MSSGLSVSTAAGMLRRRGIRCYRDWGCGPRDRTSGPARWIAEHGMKVYCLYSDDLVAAATAVDPLAALDACCA